MMFAHKPRSTIFVLLDYCGGSRTDALFGKIAAWNPGAPIWVLDNASPRDAPSCATHRNSENSYIGGGIRDCVRLAEEAGADFLFFCTNDVEFLDPLRIGEFEALALADSDVVVVSCALHRESCQAEAFPWMVRRNGTATRSVHHADLNCCLLRLDFLRSYGGFPPSLGGWGFAHEIAYQAELQAKTILIVDACAIRHERSDLHLVLDSGEIVNKQREREAVYSKRYGDWRIPVANQPCRDAANSAGTDMSEVLQKLATSAR